MPTAAIAGALAAVLGRKRTGSQLYETKQTLEEMRLAVLSDVEEMLEKHLPTLEADLWAMQDITDVRLEDRDAIKVQLKKTHANKIISDFRRRCSKYLYDNQSL